MTHRQAVFELLYWQYSCGADNFNSGIFHLFQKADPLNRFRLQRGFPELHAAWKEWHDSPSQDEFFEKYGFTRDSLKQPQEFE